MVSTVARRGVNASAAIKVPCIAASTGNLTLSGEQTVDGIALVEDDRVFAKDQTDTTEIGIYTVSTGTWTRALDFDGSYDVVEGTIIPVSRGTANADTYWRITNTGTITIGTTALTVQATTVLDSAILNDGSVKMIADFAPNVTDSYDIGTKSLRWVDGVFSGDLVLAERADHSVTPAAGYGQAWVRSDAPCKYVFTDDAGTDFDLNHSVAQVTNHIRAGNTQLWNGDDVTLTLFDIEAAMLERVWESVGPTGSGADNIWADMDLIPAQATVLICDLTVMCLANSVSTAQMKVFTRVTGVSATFDDDYNRIGFVASDGDTTQQVWVQTRVGIPLSSNQDFEIAWDMVASDTQDAWLNYRGFMTD